MSEKKKKILMPALIAVIIAQLIAPVFMIVGKYDTLINGEEFKFIVNPVDPYDAFRGRYVNLNVQQTVSGDGVYGTIKVDADGYAYIDKLTNEKPQTGAYVKSGSRDWFSMPIDRYYMEENMAPEAEVITRQLDADKVTYVTVRVKNGSLVVSGLYIDGTSIEDVLQQPYI